MPGKLLIGKIWSRFGQSTSTVKQNNPTRGEATMPNHGSGMPFGAEFAMTRRWMTISI